MLVIFCAKYLIFAIVAIALVHAVFSKEWKRLALSAILSLPIVYLLGRLASLLWYNPRPFVLDGTAPLVAHAGNNGFPSEHMLLGAALASVVFVYNKPLGVAMWVLALAVGLARVAAGVHHAVDLVGSVAIVIGTVAAVEYALRRRSPQA